MTLKTLGMGIANVVTKKIKDKAMKEAQKQFKKVIDKKKGKDLDWSDLSKSYQIFTKK